MTGPPKSFAVTTGTNLTKTISGVTITEFVADAFGAAGTANNTFCIDIAIGQRDVRRFAEPQRHRQRSCDRPASAHRARCPASTRPNVASVPVRRQSTRVSITIFNNPANVLSSLTLNNLVLNINAATVGSVPAILTDCGDAFGPGGSLAWHHGAHAPRRPAALARLPFPAGDGRVRWCALGDRPRRSNGPAASA